jgi:hypothetical protein
MAQTQKAPPAEEDQPVAAEAKAEHHHAKPAEGSRWQNYKAWYLDHKKWTVPASVVLFILILAAVPATRYGLSGLVIKKDLSVKVLDSETNTPVSGASVSQGSLSAQTDAQGRATLRHVKAGKHQITISKKYYKAGQTVVLAPILKQKAVPAIHLVATGRQVKVSISNLINKQPLANVNIATAGVTAKTDASGSVILVVPANSSEEKASLKLNGYNDADVTIKASKDKIQTNDFSLTPAGKIYFLSKLSGKIDVVKTNLDGTGRQTVLAGTGKEDNTNTVLLASRDWKYLALLSRRAGNSPSLYLIDTSNDSLSTIDEGNATFSLTGWVGDSFVYTVTRNDIQIWQSNQQALKSFNAASRKLTTLEQSTATGTSVYNYTAQQFGSVYGYDDKVYYITNWNSSDYIVNKQATFNSIKTDGTAKNTIKSFSLAADGVTSLINLTEVIETPDKVHLSFWDGSQDKFYIFNGAQVKDEPGLNQQAFYAISSNTYLLSPSGKNTFWSEPRDGKNTLFIGDEDGQGGNQVATLSDYNTYGWYTDDYLLVSKNSSELYIMDKNGKQAPIKISDYHKPAQTFNSYGGGYGGL